MPEIRTPFLCIASPVRRSGTTLLQRLLCSSENAIIYGEGCANDLNLLVSLYSNKEMLLNQHKGWYNDQLREVLKGDVNNWIPDLMPEVDFYLEGFKKSLFSFVESIKTFSLGKGRSVYGVKLAEWNLASLSILQKILPELKIIYLYRGLEDCVRSAKKMDMVRGVNEIEQFCNIWRQNTIYAKANFSGDQVMHIDYESLIESPEIWMKQLEQFTGAKSIDRNVFKIKLNTYSNDNRLEEEKSSYLEPAELTKEEKDIVEKYLLNAPVI